MHSPVAKGIRTAQLGLLVNAGLAVVKLVAGVLGHAYALVADAIESGADVFSSAIVWGGLRIASREADEDYPFGYGKAEPIAAAVVALMLLGAAAGIAVEAIREIRTPHHTPAPFTLVVLVLVVAVKELLFRRVLAVGRATASTAVKADAWHHRSDAITSAAAFIGISVALIGGPGWESADDWAALVAAGVIAVNASALLRPAVHDLMDRSPGGGLLERISQAALATPEVRAIEKLKVRKVGLGYYVDLHVQADPALSLHDAHILSGRVKTAIRTAVPEVLGVLIHMEPHEV
ncbi:MAG TPA: cation diffusion facilitator family transporter [Gemmatimonadales bacterium]|jgi:cation diffusion facilitator family transporter|nr:cation diffusion facilitator family transporter [Gemmatimonadales bacterium]